MSKNIVKNIDMKIITRKYRGLQMISALYKYIIILIIPILITIQCSKEKPKITRTLDLKIIGDENVGTKKKVLKPDQSTYILDKVSFVKTIDDGFIKFDYQIALAYPRGKNETEWEIITKREQIMKLIQIYFTEKSYNDINTVEKRENLKRELLAVINSKIMKKTIITDIYYSHFFVIKQ